MGGSVRAKVIAMITLPRLPLIPQPTILPKTLSFELFGIRFES